AAILVKSLIDVLPEELRDKMHPFELKYRRNYYTHIPTETRCLQEMANTWRECLKTLENQERFWKQLWITTERHPDIQKQYEVTGKLLDFTVDLADAASTAEASWLPEFE
ncbi:unnamed protein product, partial [Prorocentrum cordatum]